LRFLLALALCASAALAQGEERVLELGNGKTLRYTLLDPADPVSTPSALGTAQEVLRRLADGDITEAAALSNSPRRRYEVLRDYKASVGEDEFKRVFAQYLDPQNKVVAEIAIGPHRLIVWDLGAAAHHVAGQYYVDVEGRFLMDDVPSETRANLRRVLETYRKAAATSSRQKD
jgi:hypothetical protein